MTDLTHKPFEEALKEHRGKKREPRMYTEEFRLEVVAYSDSHSIMEAANHFGVPYGTVGTWRGNRKNGTIPEGDIVNRPDQAQNSEGDKTMAISLPAGHKKEGDQLPPKAVDNIVVDEMEKRVEELKQELLILQSAIKIMGRK